MSWEYLKSYGPQKTVSNGSGKSSHLILTRTDSNQSIKSNKSTSSLNSMMPLMRKNKSITSLKGLTGFSSVGQTGLKSSAKRGKPILKLNEDDVYHEIPKKNASPATNPIEKTRESNNPDPDSPRFTEADHKPTGTHDRRELNSNGEGDDDVNEDGSGEGDGTSDDNSPSLRL
ncbi:hypothetical protein JCM33374_g36 [Metschnikowia sp. JCM 33374]|nr:hypothetical protein JCM33374_g36 [Metschnikowia sp. JCM 33374]